MRDITKLSTYAKNDRTWGIANNSIRSHEPKITLVATDRVIKILGAKYEKTDLKAVIQNNYKHKCSRANKVTRAPH